MAHHKMKIDIISLFPSMFTGPFDESIIKRAKEKGIIEINIHNLRDQALDSYGTVDDKPYGGGVGMILKPEPIVSALRELTTYNLQLKTKKIILSASGKLFTQKKANELSQLDHLIFICGHYEGVDQRIADHYCDEELSIGDYVLTGGEIPAMVIVDSVIRLIPGVLTKEDATKFESFSQPTTNNSQLLEFPQYTRPEEFEGHHVPSILLSGNHGEVAKWRAEEAIKRTKQNRPDLIK